MSEQNDFYLGDCRRCDRRSDANNQQEACARPHGRFSGQGVAGVTSHPASKTMDLHEKGVAGLEVRNREFIAAIHERTPNGESIAVKHHPNGDWSVAHEPLPVTHGWQPIETAPTNASVLVFIPNAEHYGHGVYRAMLVDMGTGRRWITTGYTIGRDCPVEDQPDTLDAAATSPGHLRMTVHLCFGLGE